MISGYPRSAYVQDFSNHFPTALFMRMPDKHFEITNIPDTAGVYDPFQYAITWTGQALKADLMSGYSGSPIFIQEKESLMWRLAGIFSSSKDVGDEKVVMIVIDSIALMQKLEQTLIPYMSQSGVLFIY